VCIGESESIRDWIARVRRSWTSNRAFCFFGGEGGLLRTGDYWGCPQEAPSPKPQGRPKPKPKPSQAHQAAMAVR
jgi:hypothetical protein